jgi:hypothetical protein
LEKGQNKTSSIKDYFATDYMLGTILFVYYLLFINTFYLSKLDSLPYLFGAYDNSLTLASLWPFANRAKAARLPCVPGLQVRRRAKGGFTLSVLDNNNKLESHNSNELDQQGLREQTNKLNP